MRKTQSSSDEDNLGSLVLGVLVTFGAFGVCTSVGDCSSTATCEDLAFELAPDSDESESVFDELCSGLHIQQPKIRTSKL